MPEQYISPENTTHFSCSKHRAENTTGIKIRNTHKPKQRRASLLNAHFHKPTEPIDEGAINVHAFGWQVDGVLLCHKFHVTDLFEAYVSYRLQSSDKHFHRKLKSFEHFERRMKSLSHFNALRVYITDTRLDLVAKGIVTSLTLIVYCVVATDILCSE